jgi:predicted glycosyltransferase
MPGTEAKPSLLLYCQHSVGLGHLTRSLALAGALADRFAVVLMSGGAVPRHVTAPPGVEIVQLPPLALEQGLGLVSGDGRRTVTRAKALRAQALVEAVRSRRPAGLVVELFPFGRRAFSGEIVAMLEAARALPGDGAVIVSSVRDILVSRGGEQAAYDERAARLANAYFDAILVHADPRFARLEESFRPRTPLAMPVHYTGFVTGASAAAAGGRRSGPIVVSAGGGRVGASLFEAAIEAQPLLWKAKRIPMRLIAGPFLPGPDWRRLRRWTRGRTGLELLRAVPDLASELRGARASVSQCGYNTALEVLQAGIPALVVPYFAPGEDEQSRRARRLAELGLVRVLDPAELDGVHLAEAIRGMALDRAPRVTLDLGGARASAELLWRMLSADIAPPTERVTA